MALLLRSKVGTTALKTARSVPGPENYRYFVGYNTRWGDNDVYAHLNNVQSIAYVDSCVNEFLINHAGLNFANKEAPIGLVVKSSFDYAASLSYPNPLIAGLAVTKLGTSSVTYSVGLFEAEDISSFAGRGRFREDMIESKDSQGNEVYGMGLRMKTGKAATYGEFVHVFTTSDGTQKSTPIPSGMRLALEKLLIK